MLNVCQMRRNVVHLLLQNSNRIKSVLVTISSQGPVLAPTKKNGGPTAPIFNLCLATSSLEFQVVDSTRRKIMIELELELEKKGLKKTCRRLLASTEKQVIKFDHTSDDE